MNYVLFCLAKLYSLAIRIRLYAYRKGILKSYRLSVPVISIGNISVGGTGKTPLTIAIAEKLKAGNFAPAILSRGYKGSFKGDFAVAADAEGLHLSARESGDEPFMMARCLPGTPVIVGPDRVKAGQETINRRHPDCLLLDDGFQHVRLQRDLNILLLDATHRIDEDQLVPYGRLREPITAIHRADLIVLSHCNSSTERIPLEDYIRSLGNSQEIIRGDHIPSALMSLDTKTKHDLEWLKGKRTFAFCGIARPDLFHQMLLDLGCELMGFLSFSDHHRYRHRELSNLNQKARNLDCELFLTTEKDSVRLDAEILTLPAYFLAIRFGFLNNEAILEQRLLELFRK